MGHNACLSFEVWIHHMFASGVPDWARVMMSYTTILVSGSHRSQDLQLDRPPFTAVR
ncbi:MAG: hypothetical protein Q9N34_08640 [Aquificota bacterium]|nr:hypothetical protein [Aquificota bacterium]